MNFFDGNGTSIRSGNEINTLKKQLKALQEQTDALSVAISDLEDTVSENKGESEQRDLALGENISINTNDINSLEENLENYKTSQAEVTENQITRSSEYIESPLGRFVDLEVSGNITGGDFDDVKDDITSLQNALEETNGNVQTNADNIETLNNKQSVTEQKVDTILEQGEIPITTDEVQLGNALISESGNFYYGKVDVPQDNDFKPVAGSIIQPDSDTSVLILKSDNVGYAFSRVTSNNADTLVSDIQNGIRFILEQLEILQGEALKNAQDGIYLNKTENELKQYSDTVKSLNAGTFKDFIILDNDNVNTFTYNDQLDYLYIVTVDKVFKYENGTLTDVTDTVTTISAHDPYISEPCYYMAYRNYVMSKQFSYKGTEIVHKYDNGKWQYWYKNA